LPNNEWDAALSESAQRLVPSVLRCGIDDIIGLCRVEIVALDPHPGGRSQLARGGRHDLAQGCRNMVSGEELDHAMTVGVANRIRRIDNDRARLLRCLEPIKDRPTFAHREYVGVGGLERRAGGVGGDKLNAEAPLRQGLADSFQDCGIVVDTARRVLELAVDAPAGLGHVHVPAFPRSRPSPADSAAAMSRARSMSNTRGRTMP